MAYEASLHWFFPSHPHVAAPSMFFVYPEHTPVSPSPSFTLYQEWCAVLIACSVKTAPSPRPGNCPCWMDPEAPAIPSVALTDSVFIQCLPFQTHRVLYESRAWSCLGHFGYLSFGTVSDPKGILLSLRDLWWQASWKNLEKDSVMAKLRSHLHSLAVLSLWKRIIYNLW